MNSAAARSKRSRSAGGWLAVGTAASSEAALMRTPRLESESSGETSGQSCAAGMLSEHVECADPHHRIGIGKCPSAPD